MNTYTYYNCIKIHGISILSFAASDRISCHSAIGQPQAVLERLSGLQEWQVLDGNSPFPARFKNGGFFPTFEHAANKNRRTLLGAL